jgi:hypothetical protein
MCDEGEFGSAIAAVTESRQSEQMRCFIKHRCLRIRAVWQRCGTAAMAHEQAAAFDSRKMHFQETPRFKDPRARLLAY